MAVSGVVRLYLAIRTHILLLHVLHLALHHSWLIVLHQNVLI